MNWHYVPEDLEMVTDEEKFEFTKSKLNELSKYRKAYNLLKAENDDLRMRISLLESESYKKNLIYNKGVSSDIVSEVHRLRSMGNSYKKIADKLSISKSTVGRIVNK